jgi:hypothetical protein
MNIHLSDFGAHLCRSPLPEHARARFLSRQEFFHAV